METLIVVEQHRDEYFTRIKQDGSDQFISSPSAEFRAVNCRSFQSGAGILPTPLKTCTTPATKQACSFSPKTPSPVSYSHSDNTKHVKTTVKSAPIPIISKVSNKHRSFFDDFSNQSFSFPELWAGPAYSNSPPPSSLPIPKFSVRPKRTVSLELPGSDKEVDLHPIAKSAPPSPTREHNHFTRDIFHSADSATETLRRILNLDLDN